MTKKKNELQTNLRFIMVIQINSQTLYKEELQN